MRGFGWLVLVIVLCSAAWYLHTDQVARQQREEALALQEEHEAAEASQRRLEAQQAAAEALRQAETERQRAELELARQRALDEDARRQKQAEEAAARRREEATAEEAKRTRLAEDQTVQQKVSEVVRADETKTKLIQALFGARSALAKLMAQKAVIAERIHVLQNYTANMKAYEANITARYDELTQNAGYSQTRLSDKNLVIYGAANHPVAVAGGSSVIGSGDVGGEGGKMLGKVESCEQDLRRWHDELDQAASDLHHTEDLASGAEMDVIHAEADLRNAGIPVPSAETKAAAKPVPHAPAAPAVAARAYPVYCLADGREIVAVQTIKTDDSFAIKDTSGKYITIRQSEVREIRQNEK